MSNFTLSCALLGNKLCLSAPAVPEAVKRLLLDGQAMDLVLNTLGLLVSLIVCRSLKPEAVEVPLITAAAQEVPFCFPPARSSEPEDTLSRGNRKRLFPVVDV